MPKIGAYQQKDDIRALDFFVYQAFKRLARKNSPIMPGLEYALPL